ncbi:uncharacterized protein GGS22DRAFT_144192 [Annulohypoxylon maeteangense]|uniref:uncharacterized protein n=1 Tax=Annulohypoxylon maeteangense TaxID=1927788 RepID=UPI0020078345|nr:uncharacterized protein GGS22DRAFT_144192 [Annulohypoxylon maeteangense]KAI0884571.1 hypothetical protein GGS22DRAFT_144192 [Annulohypoxylon maeteangense]
MGISHSVYMANGSGQDIYVMASLNPEWAIVDFIVDIGLLYVGVEEIKGVVMAAELPETLATFRDLYEFLNIARKLIMGMIAAGTRPGEAAMALLDAFKKTSIRIPYDEYKDVERDSILSIYLSADGVASLVGAENVSVMVMSGDGKQLAMWDTNADHSWIATKDGKIVRSKYGTIWQQDPAEGSVEWSVIKK